MKFTFYPTAEAAEYAQVNTASLYTIFFKGSSMYCYGGRGCGYCDFQEYPNCSVLQLLFKPDTSIEITKETHPEYFI